MSHRPTGRRNGAARRPSRTRSRFPAVLIGGGIVSWLVYLALGKVLAIGAAPALYTAGAVLGIAIGACLPTVRLVVGGRR